MSGEIVLAVDGGNSKTDLALARADGEVLALVRGPLSSPHHLGLDGSLGVLEELLGEAVRQSGIAARNGSLADVGELLLAGVDFPAEEREFWERAHRLGWAETIVVRNDTFAILRAGTERGWGVAVVCGAGINCVGIAPDGRHARFPSLGSITGDWGGGYDLGMTAVWSAARSEDGRGERTSLEASVPAFFGLGTPSELAEAFHRGHIEQRRVIELAPLVIAEAASDDVAAGIVDRLVGEVVAMARVALTRLGLEHEPVEVLLGGGLLQTADGRLVARISEGLSAVGPEIAVRSTHAPAIVGAALLGLDAVGADASAQARLRAELAAAVGRVEAEREGVTAGG